MRYLDGLNAVDEWLNEGVYGWRELLTWMIDGTKRWEKSTLLIDKSSWQSDQIKPFSRMTPTWQLLVKASNWRDNARWQALMTRSDLIGPVWTLLWPGVDLSISRQDFLDQGPIGHIPQPSMTLRSRTTPWSFKESLQHNRQACWDLDLRSVMHETYSRRSNALSPSTTLELQYNCSNRKYNKHEGGSTDESNDCEKSGKEMWRWVN